MNHQPFETWILDEEPLTLEQKQALHEHLNGCPSCQSLSAAWIGVGRLFKTTPAVKPGAGFRDRWQVRLEREEQLARRKIDRQSWMLLAIYGAGALFFLLLFAIQAFLMFDSPSELLLAGIYRLTAAYSNLNVIGEILTTLISVFSTAIPPVYWVTFVAILGLLSLIWIFSLQRLILPRRITL